MLRVKKVVHFDKRSLSLPAKTSPKIKPTVPISRTKSNRTSKNKDSRPTKNNKSRNNSRDGNQRKGHSASKYIHDPHTLQSTQTHVSKSEKQLKSSISPRPGPHSSNLAALSDKRSILDVGNRYTKKRGSCNDVKTSHSAGKKSSINTNTISNVNSTTSHKYLPDDFASTKRVPINHPNPYINQHSKILKPKKVTSPKLNSKKDANKSAPRQVHSGSVPKTKKKLSDDITPRDSKFLYKPIKITKKQSNSLPKELLKNDPKRLVKPERPKNTRNISLEESSHSKYYIPSDYASSHISKLLKPATIDTSFSSDKSDNVNKNKYLPNHRGDYSRGPVVPVPLEILQRNYPLSTNVPIEEFPFDAQTIGARNIFTETLDESTKIDEKDFQDLMNGPYLSFDSEYNDDRCKLNFDDI